MPVTDILIIGGILGAFITFAAVLGWAAHIDYKRTTRELEAFGHD